jgi:hypothetical protein
MTQTTILIKTFERPETCQRLIDSIRLYYPEIPILVADDSKENNKYSDCVLYRLPFDSGVSYGRNFLLDKAQTPYVLILDDDCVFTSDTDIELLEEMIGDNDILGFECFPSLNYVGHFEKKGKIVYMLEGEPYEFVPQIFLAKRTIPKWDESLKIGEHFAYFYKNKLKIDYTTKVSIDHLHVSNPEYDKYRERAKEYVKKFMRENDIDRKVDIDGSVTER